MKLLLFVSVLTFGQLVSSQAPIQDLVGRWVEDESVRTGLNDFLWARGNYKSIWHTLRKSRNSTTLSTPHIKKLETYFAHLCFMMVT